VGSDSHCLLALERFLAFGVLDAEHPLCSARLVQEACLLKVGIPELEDTPVSCPDLTAYRDVDEEVGDLRRERRADPGCDTSDRDRGNCGAAGGCPKDRPLPPAPELVPVAPRGELRPHRRPDADELQALFQASDTNVVSGGPKPGPSEEPFALLECLPTFLQRREVPPFTFPAHDPQPPLLWVEREPAADGERLDDLVGSERAFAEDAGRVHQSMVLVHHSLVVFVTTR
jgi:hypothetical protein